MTSVVVVTSILVVAGWVAREVSQVLDVHIHVTRSRSSCTFEGTRGQVFRAVVVSPQRLTAASRPTRHQTRYGQIVQIAGPGYRGQAQNDADAAQASALGQSNAQIVSGEVIVQLLVTYRTTGLHDLPQLGEVATLGGRRRRQAARGIGECAAVGLAAMRRR